MVRPIRRVVAGEDAAGKAVVHSDAPSPDVTLDPARPGYAATRLWVTDTTPARVKGVRETLNLPRTIEPPPQGSVCRVVEFPPEAPYIGKITAADIAAHFAAMGSPGASTAASGAPHPYMQRTRTFDFCYILEGEITLVLDTEEVHLTEGDTVIQRGTNHAWSNRSDRPCLVVFSQHDGKI
ncbi:MAG: cupin domain-containing protein [Xanthobacteraceae bacterium]|nr:cupin domain-containing protein [Xanthobacteraceae bacterium]